MALGDPYISREDLKTALGITDSAEDTIVDRAVAGATAAINNKSGYTTFWNTATAVLRSVDTDNRLVPKRAITPYFKLILPDGIASATGLLVSGYSTAKLLPSDSIAKGEPATSIKLPWGSMPDTIDITAIWGWPTLPDDIIMAAQMQAQRYYKRRGSPEGIAGSAEWGQVRIPRLDPDVVAILTDGGYMNPGIG
jgi:hypothetical protein